MEERLEVVTIGIGIGPMIRHEHMSCIIDQLRELDISPLLLSDILDKPIEEQAALFAAIKPTAKELSDILQVPISSEIKDRPSMAQWALECLSDLPTIPSGQPKPQYKHVGAHVKSTNKTSQQRVKMYSRQRRG